jgi:hypothetical protein
VNANEKIKKGKEKVLFDGLEASRFYHFRQEMDFPDCLMENL